MVSAGKKAAQTRKTGSYNFDQHIGGKSEAVAFLALSVHEYILGLDAAIQSAPKKFYVAYKLSQNIVCMEIKKKNVILYLKLDPKKLETLPPIARDVTSIGHYGTGDLELVLETPADFETAKPFILQAYQKIGG
jgi:predicted transport protein